MRHISTLGLFLNVVLILLAQPGICYSDLDSLKSFLFQKYSSFQQSDHREVDYYNFAERFRFLKSLGSGEHGLVGLFENKKSGRLVSIKFSNNQDKVELATNQEIKILKKIKPIHGVINLQGFGQLGPLYYFVSQAVQRLDGLQNLKDFIDQKKISSNQALSYLAQISSTLSQLHRIGVTHSDLKSDNFLIDDDESITLIDFGLAEKLRKKDRRTEWTGTLLYTSPEALNSNSIDSYDPKTNDVWAMGCTFYEILTGKPPYYVWSRKKYEFSPSNWSTTTKSVELNQTCPLCFELLGYMLEQDMNRRKSANWISIKLKPFLPKKTRWGTRWGSRWG